MKTNKIFIGELCKLNKINYFGTLEDYLFGPGVLEKVNYTHLTYVLIKTRKNASYKLVGKDLNTNKKYLCEIPLDCGKLFISPKSMVAFDAIYPNSKANLPKRKVLEMGNEAINQMTKNNK